MNLKPDKFLATRMTAPPAVFVVPLKVNVLLPFLVAVMTNFVFGDLEEIVSTYLFALALVTLRVPLLGVIPLEGVLTPEAAEFAV